GKAGKRLQDDCQKDVCEGFPQHYLISAFYTYAIFKKAFNLEFNTNKIIALLNEDRGDRVELIGLLIVLPVAFHHYHQVESYRSYEVGNRRWEDYLVHTACEDCLKSLGEFVKEKFIVLRKVGYNLENLPNMLISDRETVQISWIFMSNINEIITHIVRPRSFLTMAIEAITGVINLCDGTVARIHRRREYRN
ncbi:MAG: hypothetical protein QXS92_04675, partial [Thermofilum sp.]